MLFKKAQYRKVQQLIGQVVNLSQMIEYNLANILAINEILVAFGKDGSMYVFEYNKLMKKTDEWYAKLDSFELGKILETVKSKSLFSDGFIKRLDNVRMQRNYYLHSFFKDDLFTKAFQNKPQQFVKKLKELITEMGIANYGLIDILSSLKNELKTIY